MAAAAEGSGAAAWQCPRTQELKFLDNFFVFETTSSLTTLVEIEHSSLPSRGGVCGLGP